MEPIEKGLKSEKQAAIARIQDYVIESVLAIDQNIIMHGGTAIWRCYNGKRFSYGIDMYATDSQVEKLMKELSGQVSKRGIMMDYPIHTKRIIDMHNSEANVKLELLPKPKLKSVQMEYVKADGTKMFVNTLSASDFVLEKIKAYESREYARDLYDIYHLISTTNINAKAKKAQAKFLLHIKKPNDGTQLSDLVYEGIAPTFTTMITYIRESLK
jgi:predicted nucleotidyltransferase component of viral defense system